MGALQEKARGRTIGQGGAQVPAASTEPVSQEKSSGFSFFGKKKNKQPKSTINRAADRQLGVLESEGY